MSETLTRDRSTLTLPKSFTRFISYLSAGDGDGGFAAAITFGEGIDHVYFAAALGERFFRHSCI
jgi:hypothetical protein